MTRQLKPSLFLITAGVILAWQAILSGNMLALCEGSQPAAQLGKPNFELKGNEAAELSAKINEMVVKDFVYESKVKIAWTPSFETFKSSLASQTNLLDYSAKMNEILHSLNASHTALFTENDESFYFMRSLFGAFKKDEKDPHKNDADFTGLGVGGGHASANQVRYVLDASPAAKAGFKRGDLILTVNGQPYTGYAVWYETSGKQIDVAVERQGKRVDLKIEPVKQDFLNGYLNATENSARIILHNKKRVAYLHFWSGGQGSHDLLESALGTTLRDSDALVLDLRDGYGGASFEDLNMFFRPHSAFPDVKSVSRKESGSERAFYDKPMAVLINSGSRSGKELMAFGLKRSQRAKLFGENTAGYVLAGRFNPLNSRVILYLAVADVLLDGKSIEGKGVAPDVLVVDKLGPDDPVLVKALDYLSPMQTSSKK